ncbi:carbamoyltransferase HypF, partial [Acidobacteriota bacterium]
PGGDLAAKEPWRMALSYLRDAFGDVPLEGILKEVEEKKIKGVSNAIEKKINSPLTSSAGRLFDAVSAILGIAPLRIDYEAEGPMKLETVASKGVKDYYHFDIDGQDIDMRNVIRELVEDKASVPIKSAKFHNTLVNIIVDITQRFRETKGIEKVILGGGVFLNSYLLSHVLNKLTDKGIKVFMPKMFSFGDEGISAGQAFYAAHQILRGEKCV